MRALYDLGRFIAGFDFFNWLVQVKAAGATEVVFNSSRPKTDKWDLATVRRRFESILLPGPALAGLRCSEGTSGEIVASPHTLSLVKFCEGGRIPPRLLSVLPPAEGIRFTVTLRRTERSSNRNSLEDEWRGFADEIGAAVIEEYAVRPIGLHQRVAMYAAAEMNFFVTNGPAGMCSLTPYPMVMFDCDIAMGPPPGRYGIEYGAPRYPWMVDDQHLAWEPGTRDNARRWFDKWLSGRKNV